MWPLEALGLAVLGLQLDSMIFKVFSHLRNSMILIQGSGKIATNMNVH